LVTSVKNKAPGWRGNPSRKDATGATRRKYEKAFEFSASD
jgi:hypothetical protein